MADMNERDHSLLDISTSRCFQRSGMEALYYETSARVLQDAESQEGNTLERRVDFVLYGA